MRFLDEISRRKEFYLDDWTVAFRSSANFFKVLAATIYILFTSIAPAVTFASFLTSKTEGQYSTIDVLLSTGANGVLYSIFSAQPLVIVGVTGPVSVFLETLFNLNKQFINTEFLPFVFWIGIWACCIHLVLGITGACSVVKYVTPYTCEVFSAFIGCVYIYTATRQIIEVFVGNTISSGLLVAILAVMTLVICRSGSNARSWKAFTKFIRGLTADYIIPLAILFVTALYQIPVLHQVSIDLLPTASTFGPSNGRTSFLVNPLNTPIPLIFAAIIPAIILTILIFFDHNVSALLAEKQKGVQLQKPSAFNYDFIVIGILMALTGLFGLPFTHGLIPQAPLHVLALSTPKVTEEVVLDENLPMNESLQPVPLKYDTIEQRVSNFTQSILTILFCTISALLHLLSLIPVASLNGLLLFMGLEAFNNNAFVSRLYGLILVDVQYRPTVPFWPSIDISKTKIFVLSQGIMLIIIFGITVSPLAILFPIAIVVTVLVRMVIGSEWLGMMSDRDLEVLDGDGDVEGDIGVGFEIGLADLS